MLVEEQLGIVHANAAAGEMLRVREFDKTGCSRQAELVELAASMSLPV